MSCDRLTQLDDATLLRALSTLVARECATTADILAHIAEVDARRLYLAAACSSMFAYCVGELGFSEDAAYKRIQAARAARRFPRLFADVAAGRIHLTALGLLAPHLDAANVDECVAAAAGRTKHELERWIAERFPGSGAGPASLRARVIVIPRATAAVPTVADVPAGGELALAQAAPPVPVTELALAQVVAPAPPPSPKLAPAQVPAPARYVLQVPISEATHAKVRRAQALLAHAVPSGDLAEVLDRALDTLLARLEKRKGAAPATRRQKPDPAQAPAPDQGTTAPRSRTIPADVRRAVWQRDGGRCTFTSPAGRRCGAQKRLEFDHIKAFARGGRSTIEGLRLRCRAHNQLEAERTFGAGFMRRKRDEARGAASPGLSRQVGATERGAEGAG